MDPGDQRSHRDPVEKKQRDHDDQQLSVSVASWLPAAHQEGQ